MIIASALMSLSACTSSAPIEATTRCSDYLNHSPDERQRAAAKVSVENQTSDAGNPMQYLNADTYCTRNPDRTLSDAVGKSLSQYRAEQQRSSEASAPPEVKTSEVNGVTHLSDVCTPGQSTTKIVISASSGGSSEDGQIVVTANGKKIFEVNPRDIKEDKLARLVSIPCRGPVDVRQINADAFNKVSVFWPGRPGLLLNSTDTASTSGPPLTYPSATEADGSGYHIVMDS